MRRRIIASLFVVALFVAPAASSQWVKGKPGKGGGQAKVAAPGKAHPNPGPTSY